MSIEFTHSATGWDLSERTSAAFSGAAAAADSSSAIHSGLTKKLAPSNGFPEAGWGWAPTGSAWMTMQEMISSSSSRFMGVLAQARKRRQPRRYDRWNRSEHHDQEERRVTERIRERPA